MPEHLVAEHIATGKLKTIKILNDPTPVEGLTIYAAHMWTKALGPAGRWLLSDIRGRLDQDS